jgi:hypothetical protein
MSTNPGYHPAKLEGPAEFKGSCVIVRPDRQFSMRGSETFLSSEAACRVCTCARRGISSAVGHSSDRCKCALYTKREGSPESIEPPAINYYSTWGPTCQITAAGNNFVLPRFHYGLASRKTVTI